MKKLKINNKMAILVLFACIVTAFSFLKSSAVSSQKNEVRTNPNTEYQITYELNGGRFEGEYPKTFKISQETAIPNPIKDGSEFLGWTINDKTNLEPIKDYKIPSITQGDVKLIANWKNRGNILYRGDIFNTLIQRMNGFINIKNITFNYGIPSDISNYVKIDVSEAQNGNIIAYINGDTLNVVSNEEIIANSDCYQMFYYLNTITNIEFNNFNTSQVKRTESMFRACNSLTEIVGLDKWDTNQVTDMSWMFSNCNSLKCIDVSKFNTSKAISMYQMFANCSSLTSEITISNPNISSYTSMFEGCSTNPSAKFIVKYIDSATKEVARQMVETKKSGTTIGNVFLYEEPNILCNGYTFNEKIRTLSDISNAYTNVTDIIFNYEIPSNISNYKNIDVSEAQNGSIIAYLDGKTIYVVSNGDIIANKSAGDMFKNGITLKNITLKNFNFNTSEKTDARDLFKDCSFLKSLDLSGWDTSSVINMDGMFGGCIRLEEIVGLENWNTSSLKSANMMFWSCKVLNGEITITNPNISSYNGMFYDCSIYNDTKFIVKYISPETKEVARQMVNTKLAGNNVFLYSIPILENGKSFNDTVKRISGFSNIEEIRFIKEKPNLNGVDVSETRDKSIIASIEGTVLKVACEDEIMANPDSSYMFYELENIKNIDFNNFNTSQVINMEGIFYRCRNLTSLDVSNFDTSQVTNMNSMFATCENLKNIDISTLNTSNVDDISYMFAWSTQLTEIIGLDKLNTSKLTKIQYTFMDCNSLITLDLNGWNISNVTDMRSMFSNCTKLTKIIGLENWDTSQVSYTREMFNNCKNLSGEITIMNTNVIDFYHMFWTCSTEPNTKFVVKYIDENTKGMASDMVATKNSGTKVGNVYLYEETTVNDIPNDEEPSVPDTVTLTIKDGNKSTMKEIIAGEIGNLNTPSKEGMVFSGYFYDIEYIKPVSERDVISEDTTIYIKWEEIPQEENKDESLKIA